MNSLNPLLVLSFFLPSFSICVVHQPFFSRFSFAPPLFSHSSSFPAYDWSFLALGVKEEMALERVNFCRLFVMVFFL